MMLKQTTYDDGNDDNDEDVDDDDVDNIISWGFFCWRT